MAGYPWHVLFFMHPILVGVSIWFFHKVWTVSGILPVYFVNLNEDVPVSLYCVSVSAIPTVCMVVAVMLSRMFTRAHDVLGKDQPVFYEVTRNVLENTLEQNFLFAVNLLAANSLHALSVEQMFIITGVHVVSRLLFWLFYLVGAYVKYHPISGIPFWFTFMNNLLLLGNNMLEMYKLVNTHFLIN